MRCGVGRGQSCEVGGQENGKKVAHVGREQRVMGRFLLDTVD